jgi:ketosteroid isomerase-like protein
VLDRILAASRARDGDALAELYDGQAVWLAPEGTLRGREAAVAAHLAIAAEARGWSAPQQRGATGSSSPRRPEAQPPPPMSRRALGR